MRLRHAALVLLLATGCDSLAEPPPFTPDPSAEPWTEMLATVNAQRAQGADCGGDRYPAAGPLAWNSRLERAAERHTRDMMENEHFGHTGTDGSGPGDRARRAGYEWRVVGENIARYQTTVGEVVADWMASPGHCRQIMDPAFVEMGAAEDGRYWTQVFGLPR